MADPARDSTVLVVGLGDLGARIADALARLPMGRLVTAARNPERASEVAGRAAIVAALADGAARVQPATLDLDAPGAAEALFAELRPDVVVAAASRHSWWRTPEPLRALPYGVWVSLQVPLVRALTEARAAAAPAARVIALPHPDVVGPVLAGVGLAPDCGAGNVAEIAAKIAHAAAGAAGVERARVRVRLVAHHAAERYAFGAFADLGGSTAPPTAPPVRAEVTVDGEPLPEDAVRELLAAPHPLGAGVVTHQITAAATASAVAALLGDTPRAVHLPAPDGRPGGYPVLASRAGIALDLPAGLDEESARGVNVVAARWDGVEQIAADGTVTFTDAVAELSEELLGLRLERVAPDEHGAVGAELRARAAATR